MASLADMLVGSALQSSSQPAQVGTGSLQAGIDLAKHIDNVQAQRAELEQKKQQHELAKFEKVGSWIETAAKMPDGSAKKAFVNDFIPKGIQALGVADKIDPTVLKMMQGDPSLGSFLKDQIGRGKVTMSILSSPDGVASLAASPEYQQFGGLEALKNTTEEYRPKLEKAQEDRLQQEATRENARVMAGQKGVQQNIGNLQDLRKEYTSHPTTKKTFEVSDAYSKIKSSLGAKSPSAAQDMAGIFSFMKMQDPGSTVREGEYANAKNAGGVEDWVLSAYNKARDGQILTPKQRKDFLGTAGNIYRSQFNQQKKVDADYTEVAQATGLKPKLVVTGAKLNEPPQEKRDFTVSAKQKELFVKATPAEREAIIKRAVETFGATPEEVRRKLGGG